MQIDTGLARTQTVSCFVDKRRTMKKLVTPLFIIVGLIGVSGTGAIAQTAAETTDQFYAKLASLNIRGLPDADQLKEISPFLSSNIIAVIRRDQKKQDAFSKKRPDEKPPWAEGDLFSSLFEGISLAEPGGWEARPTSTSNSNTPTGQTHQGGPIPRSLRRRRENGASRIFFTRADGNSNQAAACSMR